MCPMALSTTRAVALSKSMRSEIPSARCVMSSSVIGKIISFLHGSPQGQLSLTSAQAPLKLGLEFNGTPRLDRIIAESLVAPRSRLGSWIVPDGQHYKRGVVEG